MTPGQLARNHRAYSWRIVIGPTFRADMWAEMEGTPGLKAAQIARKTYGSAAMEKEGLRAVGEPVWARYDPPFMPWFLRTNEILVEIAP